MTNLLTLSVWSRRSHFKWNVSYCLYICKCIQNATSHFPRMKRCFPDTRASGCVYCPESVWPHPQTQTSAVNVVSAAAGVWNEEDAWVRLFDAAHPKCSTAEILGFRQNEQQQQEKNQKQTPREGWLQVTRHQTKNQAKQDRIVYCTGKAVNKYCCHGDNAPQALVCVRDVEKWDERGSIVHC